MSGVDDVQVTARISTPTGWLDLEDPEGGYELHPETLSGGSVSYRTVIASSPWVEGDVATSAVRENVLEALSVWVTGDTPHEFYTRWKRLTDALEQRAFTVELTVEDAAFTWTVTRPAEHTTDTQQAFLVARTGLVRAKVARLPELTVGTP